MTDEIGAVAGNIWLKLEKGGETSYSALKKNVNAKPPLFDWAVGWLAREDKISIRKDKQILRIRLK